MSALWLVLIVGVLLGLPAGWAVHREEDQQYVERRALFLARQMTGSLPPPELPDPADVIDAEIVTAWSTRLDRPEVTR